MRRLSGIDEAGKLQTMFAAERLLEQQLSKLGKAKSAIHKLVLSIAIGTSGIKVMLDPAAFDITADSRWTLSIPLPVRRPFREAKLRIDPAAAGGKAPDALLALIAEAMEAQRLVLASPELSLNQLGKREGRCRTHLARLLRISWLSPRIIEVITAGIAPGNLNRKTLLSTDIPFCWTEQEQLFGLAA